METTSTEQKINPSNLMSVPDFARAQGVDRRTIYNWLKESKVKQVEFLGKTWIDKSTLKLR